MDSKMSLQDLEKVRILGEGTYGKCYLVHNQAVNDLCVLKQVEIFGMSEEQQEEVIREAKILSALNHPTIIRFLSCFKTQSYLNIVMEYADGGDLNRLIKDAKGVPFSESKVLSWFTQICLAIKHVHDRKVIHRDLKCQNVFITKEGRVKLGDFGIARHLSRTLDKIKTVVGTPYYMSPQICENKDYSFKTDIWSLGVILYEMCAQKLPFEGGSLPFLALKISRGEFEPLASNKYSKELKALINSLLQSNPNRRPTINKILEHPLLSKRIQEYLPQQIFDRQFSHTTMHCHNLFLKENHHQEIDEYGRQEYMAMENRSAVEAKQVHSARVHNAGIKAVRSPQSKNSDCEIGFNKEKRRKRIEPLKRREVSEPNLVHNKNVVRSENLMAIDQTERPQTKAQPLVTETFGQKTDQLIEDMEFKQGLALQGDSMNSGTLALYYGLQKFQDVL